MKLLKEQKLRLKLSIDALKDKDVTTNKMVKKIIEEEVVK